MGLVDIYHSRRTNYSECLFWNPEDRSSERALNEWVLKNKPEGKFYAKMVANGASQRNPINGVWMFDKTLITITTEDNVKSVRNGSIVMMHGRLWTVDNIQYKEHLKENMFNKNFEGSYIISLRR